MMRRYFPGRLKSRGSDYSYPSNSPDLTPPDAYLWGIIKEKIYRDPVPYDRNTLKDNIRRVMNEIPSYICKAIINNLQERYEKCIAIQGEHTEHIISTYKCC